MEIVVGGVGDGERLYSHNLRDFLSIKEEDHHRNINQNTSSTSGGDGNRRRSSSGITLSAVLMSDKGGFPPPLEEPPLQRLQSNRTLLDIIRDDHITGIGRGQGREDGRSSWRNLKDKIRLRRRGGGASWSPAVLITPHDVLSNNSNRFSPRHHSNRFNSVESTQPHDQANTSPRRRSVINDNNRQQNAEVSEERGGGVDGEDSPEQPMRMSLMALLAENDRQMGYESSAYMMEEDEDEVTVAVADAVKGVEYNNCCVCMVRHKGAAFIPCGHTFCRLCSRELWVQRGNCPLCNNPILEILDIF